MIRSSGPLFFCLLTVVGGGAEAQGQEASALSCCEVVLTPLGVKLGSYHGPGAITAGPLDVALDSNGRYWLATEGRAPRVFDSTGVFLASVGRIDPGASSSGEVGSFEWPTGFFTAGDSIVVLDSPGRSATVIAADLRPATRLAFEAPVSRAVVLRWPDSVVVGSPLRNPDAIGWPLHIGSFAGDEVDYYHSFGSTGGMATGNDFAEGRLARHVATMSDRSVVSGERYSPVIHRFNADFGLTKTIAVERRLIPGARPGGRVTAVTADRESTIWAFWFSAVAAGEVEGEPMTLVMASPAHADAPTVDSIPGVVFDEVQPGVVALLEIDDEGRFFVQLARVDLAGIERASHTNRTRRHP